MATLTTSLPASVSSLANFKLWAKAIDDFFGTAGWVTNGDTGAVNWTTLATAPTAGNFVFAVWKMGDTLQATLPVFCKMEYGNQTGNIPQIAITFGTGSNGSGTLTNAGTRYVHQNSVSTTTAFTSYLSGGTNRLSWLLWETSTDANALFALTVERHKDNAGADVGTYFFTAMLDGVTIQQQSFSPLSPVPTENRLMAFIPVVNSTGVFDSTTWFCPVFPFVGKMDNPVFMGIVKQGDATEGATVTVSMYGASHSFISSTKSQYSTAGPAGACALCIRYE